MEKKEIITINGGLGSGKSSASKLAAEKLGFTFFSSGDFFRQVGIELGLSINEVNERAESNMEIDRMTDEKLRQLRDKSKIVVDSHTAWHWIPESFKVYLDLSPELATKRILNNLKENTLRKKSEDASTPEEIHEKIINRLESEKKRFKELYDIDHTDKNNFDLVIDTEKNNLGEVVEIIISEYKKWIEK